MTLAVFDTIVVESVVETPDTRTLVLEMEHGGGYRAGQYVSIDPHQFAGLRSFVSYFEEVKGRREAPRAYSMCSAPHEPRIAITVKEEVHEPGVTKFAPLLSGFLVHHLDAGDPLTVRGFAGGYVLPDDIESRTSHVLHLCAGSGSVPNFSMIKDSLVRHARLRHTFIYSNKTWQDVIFRDALTGLRDAHPDRLRVIHALTRESGAMPAFDQVVRGRVSEDLLRATVEAEPESIVYICGPAVSVWERRAHPGETPPPRFMEHALALLAKIGVPRDRIEIEAFG